MATKKTLYHSELAKFGAVDIEVLSDLIESKYKKGTFIVGIRIDGEERTYQVESDQCAEALAERKGHLLRIEATGSREEAEITIIGEGEAPPAARPTARPQAKPTARPQAQSRPAAAPARQAAPAAQNKQKLGSTAALIQLGNLEIKVQCMVEAVSNALISGRDITLSESQLSGMAGRFFIEMVRAGFHQGMPVDHIIDCRPKGAPAQEPAPAEPSDNDGGAE